LANGSQLLATASARLPGKRDVAIKILPDSLAADPDGMARFEREGQILALLNHTNIASI